MGPTQGRAVGLGHSDIRELSFLDHLLESPGALFNRNLGVDSSTLEEVQFLCSPEVFVDVVNATSQVFLTAHSLSYGSGGTEGRNLRRIWVQDSGFGTSFDGQECFVRVSWVLLKERSN